MLAQLTGRSANLFLLNADETIIHALRRPMGEGQQLSEKYKPPPQSSNRISVSQFIALGSFQTISEAIAEFYRRVETEDEFKNAAAKLKDRVRRETVKREKLLANLQKDLAGHGDADEHKRLGDLLLANIANAKRYGDRLTLTDYYAEGQPNIEMTIDENKSIQDARLNLFHVMAKRSGLSGKLERGWRKLFKNLKNLKRGRQSLTTQ